MITVPLRKEAILNLGEFYGRGAFRIVIRHVIDPSADGIAPHQPSIVGLQQFGSCNSIPHSRKLCRVRLRALPKRGSTLQHYLKFIVPVTSSALH
jgi:hypothetical protein